MHNGITPPAIAPAEGKIRTSVKLNPRVHEAGKLLAKADRRDFQDWVEVQIEEMWATKFPGVPMPAMPAAPAPKEEAA